MKRKLPESSGASPGTEENFVDRWSRLKRDATGGGPGSQTSSGMREAGKALTDEDMPDIESLTPDSDYTGFLSPQVSDGLRRLALRKLFQGAEFNIRDGLDDYDQDFTGFAGLGSVVTADMKHLLEQEKRHVAERGRDDMSNAHSKPRAAALAAMEQVQVTPTGMVEYRAGGTLAIIGGSEAVAAADRLPAALSAKVLLVADGVNEAPLHIRVEQESLKLEGYLGAFRVLFTQAGKPMEMEVDMVLDLSAQPLLPVSLPPPGYIHCAPDEDAIKAAVACLEQLTGTFDKPEYFRYDPDRCAHARNGVIACTRCIDACPAQAIHSLLERVKVDPYLCQGGGSAPRSVPAAPSVTPILQVGIWAAVCVVCCRHFVKPGARRRCCCFMPERVCLKRSSAPRCRCFQLKWRRLPASVLKAGSPHLPGVRTGSCSNWARIHPTR